MAAIPVQENTLAGLTVSYVAAGAGDAILNDGRVIIRYRNTNAAARIVTITPQKKVKGVTLTPIAVTVPLTNGDKEIGPFDPEIFNQADGTLAITYDQTAGLTVAAVHTP